MNLGNEDVDGFIEENWETVSESEYSKINLTASIVMTQQSLYLNYSSGMKGPMNRVWRVSDGCLILRLNSS